MIHPRFLNLCYQTDSDRVKYTGAKAAAEFEVLQYLEPALAQRRKRSPRPRKHFRRDTTAAVTDRLPILNVKPKNNNNDKKKTTQNNWPTLNEVKFSRAKSGKKKCLKAFR